MLCLRRYLHLLWKPQRLSGAPPLRRSHVPRLQGKADAPRGRPVHAFVLLGTKKAIFFIVASLRTFPPLRSDRTHSWSALTSTTTTATSPTAPSAAEAGKCSCVATTTAAGPSAPNLSMLLCSGIGMQRSLPLWSGPGFLFHNRINSAINVKYYLCSSLSITPQANSSREDLFTQMFSLFCHL